MHTCTVHVCTQVLHTQLTLAHRAHMCAHLHTCTRMHTHVQLTCAHTAHTCTQVLHTHAPTQGPCGGTASSAPSSPPPPALPRGALPGSPAGLLLHFFPRGSFFGPVACTPGPRVTNHDASLARASHPSRVPWPPWLLFFCLKSGHRDPARRRPPARALIVMELHCRVEQAR